MNIFRFDKKQSGKKSARHLTRDSIIFIGIIALGILFLLLLLWEAYLLFIIFAGDDTEVALEAGAEFVTREELKKTIELLNERQETFERVFELYSHAQ